MPLGRERWHTEALLATGPIVTSVSGMMRGSVVAQQDTVSRPGMHIGGCR
jgi:hypothetical protein